MLQVTTFLGMGQGEAALMEEAKGEGKAAGVE
jgi:hypothetical protein